MSNPVSLFVVSTFYVEMGYVECLLWFYYTHPHTNVCRGNDPRRKSMNDRSITLDGEELEEVKDNGGTIVIERYINGDLCTLEINLHC